MEIYGCPVLRWISNWFQLCDWAPSNDRITTWVSIWCIIHLCTQISIWLGVLVTISSLRRVRYDWNTDVDLHWCTLISWLMTTILLIPWIMTHDYCIVDTMNITINILGLMWIHVVDDMCSHMPLRHASGPIPRGKLAHGKIIRSHNRMGASGDSQDPTVWPWVST